MSRRIALRRRQWNRWPSQNAADFGDENREGRG
jgi:hypothetical protein